MEANEVFFKVYKISVTVSCMTVERMERAPSDSVSDATSLQGSQSGGYIKKI